MINDNNSKEILFETVKKNYSRRWTILTVILCIILGFILGYSIAYGIHKKSKDYHSPSSNHNLFPEAILKNINNNTIKENLRSFTRESHRAGGPNSREYAEEIMMLWKSYGLTDIEIKQYNVMLSEPKGSGIVTVVNKATNETMFRSSPNETVLIPEENIEHVVPFNAYSASGYVEGDLVYVNYARVRDFQYLQMLKVNLTGKILLCKYGKIFRANKVELAEAAGAKGLIIYSDPIDYSLGSVKYPHSWWLPSDGVQRGTINHLDADPQTLGYPAIDGIYRTEEDKIQTPKIPVHPLSYSDALEIFRYMNGMDAPKSWQGGLNVTYRITSNRTFTLKVDVVNKKNTPIYNVVGKFIGDVEPDRYVMLGNHHDAWVTGAVDPASGTAVLTEIVRSIAKAVRKGWKPRRTIMFCSWDAEEYGLIGSTEWVEDHAAIMPNIVAYLNVDSAVEGNFTLTAKVSSQLATALFQAAKQVEDPDESAPTNLFSTWRKKLPEKNFPQYPSIRIPASGSDFKTFFTRYGIPVTNIAYDFDWDVVGHIASLPTYHSLHDSFYNFEKFVDPTFKYSATVGKVWTALATSLANSHILPFNFTDYGRRLKICHDDFKRKKYFSKLPSEVINRFSFVTEALQKFITAANIFHEHVEKEVKKKKKNQLLKVRIINDKMMAVERSFISPRGLHNRPYTRHVLYGPSKFNIYRGSCFPGLTDTVIERSYYNLSNEARLHEEVSKVYYHLLQGVQTLTF